MYKYTFGCIGGGACAGVGWAAGGSPGITLKIYINIKWITV